MNDMHPDDLVRPCGVEITSFKSLMDHPTKVNVRERKRVTFCEGPTGVLQTSPQGTRGGQGGLPARLQDRCGQDEEDLSNG